MDDQRLIASPDVTDLERRLLESWNEERPAPAARASVLASLGLATAGGVTAASAVATSVAPKALAATATALTKWTLVGVVAIGAAGAGAYVATHRDTSAPARIEHTVPVVQARHGAVPEARVEPAVQATARTAPEPIRTHASPAASTLTQQIAALDRARTALDGGDPSRARHLVDAYEAEYPAGAFTQEAEVVRIDALVREGNRAEADRLAKRFLATYPKSPHAVRVRGLLGYDP